MSHTCISAFTIRITELRKKQHSTPRDHHDLCYLGLRVDKHVVQNVIHERSACTGLD